MRCPFCGADVAANAERCTQCARELPRATMWVETPLCYTHVCDDCGGETEVYDRSYWTEIECSSCGKLFLANPPVDSG